MLSSSRVSIVNRTRIVLTGASSTSTPFLIPKPSPNPSARSRTKIRTPIMYRFILPASDRFQTMPSLSSSSCIRRKLALLLREGASFSREVMGYDMG